ncbi:MAG: hypothetical protein AAF747_09990, partial [Planctomycetota bacterium]
GDGFIELGEFDIVGGWTQQPHVVLGHPLTGSTVAFVGSIDIPTAGQFFRGYTRLSMIDLSVPFGAPGSVISIYEGAGSSPAVAGRSLYTIGADGIVGIGTYCAGDIDLSGASNFYDVIAYLRLLDAQALDSDVTLDGSITAEDVQEVLNRVATGCH